MAKLTAKHQNSLQLAAKENLAGHTDTTLRLCKQLLRHNPRDFQTKLMLATIYVSMRQFIEALNYANKAHKINARNANAAQWVAVIQQQLGDLPGAEKTLSRNEQGFATAMYFNERVYKSLSQSMHSQGYLVENENGYLRHSVNV